MERPTAITYPLLTTGEKSVHDRAYIALLRDRRQQHVLDPLA
jgi:hypothetical protein